MDIYRVWFTLTKNPESRFGLLCTYKVTSNKWYKVTLSKIKVSTYQCMLDGFLNSHTHWKKLNFFSKEITVEDFFHFLNLILIEQWNPSELERAPKGRRPVGASLKNYEFLKNFEGE